MTSIISPSISWYGYARLYRQSTHAPRCARRSRGSLPTSLRSSKCSVPFGRFSMASRLIISVLAALMLLNVCDSSSSTRRSVSILADVGTFGMVGKITFTTEKSVPGVSADYIPGYTFEDGVIHDYIAYTREAKKKPR